MSKSARASQSDETFLEEELETKEQPEDTEEAGRFQALEEVLLPPPRKLSSGSEKKPFGVLKRPNSAPPEAGSKQTPAVPDQSKTTEDNNQPAFPIFVAKVTTSPNE